MCHGLVVTRCNIVQDDVDQVMLSCLGTDIESIDIVQVFLDSTCLFDIPDHVKSSVWHVMHPIVLPNGILALFSSIKLMLIRFPLFLYISFYTYANVGQSLYLVVVLHDSEVIIHLKD